MTIKKAKLLFLLWVVIVSIMGCQTAPQLSPEELRAKWRGPITITAFNTAICTSIAGTAQKIQGEETDGFTAFGELMAAAIMLKAVEDNLAEGFSAEDSAGFYAQVRADVDALKGVVGPWVNDEITPAEVVIRMEDTCSDINQTFEKVVKAAADEGLSRDDVAEFLDELSRSMESVGE